MTEDATASAAPTTPEFEVDVRLLKESARLRLPPVSLGTLRNMGFCIVNENSLYRLWKIDIKLICAYGCKVEDLLR